MISIARVRELAASPRPTPQRAEQSCHKHPHATRAAALKSARYYSGSRPDRLGKRPPAEPYRCPHCGAWHVGHRDERYLHPEVVARRKKGG